MTVQFRGVSSRSSSNNGATLSVTQDIPSLTDGDYIEMAVYANAAPTFPPDPPAGWTLIEKENAGTFFVHVYGKIASSEPGSYTLTKTSGGTAQVYGAVLIAHYSDTGVPLFPDAHDHQANTSSTNRTCPGVTTTRASAALTCFYCGNALQTSTPPGDMTERWDNSMQSALVAYCMSAILTVAGATGTKVATGTAMATRCVTISLVEGLVGSANITLDAVTLAAVGTNPRSGAASLTLGAVTLAAVGTNPRTGDASITLGAVTLTAVATNPRTGDADITLGDITLSAAATNPRTGDADITLGAVSLAAVGKASIKGAAAIALDAVSLVAAGLLPPPAPTGVSATGFTTSSISLSWSYVGQVVDGFSIERSSDGLTGWSEITTTDAATFSYLDTGLPSNTRRYYRIRAFRL